MLMKNVNLAILSLQNFSLLKQMGKYFSRKMFVTLSIGGKNRNVGGSKQQNKTTSTQILFQSNKNIQSFKCVGYDSLP